MIKLKENVLIGLSSIAIILSIIAIVSVFAVPLSNISSNSVGEKQLIDNSVSSNKIINGTITDKDISDSGISKITDSAINSDKIADNAVTTDKLANDVLRWDNIKNKPLEVVAAGKISRTGIILNGYNIGSVNFNQEEGLYDITISGVNYSQKLYVTLVTPEYSHVSVGVVRNYAWLRVVVRENGYASESGFDFVVYDIND